MGWSTDTITLTHEIATMREARQGALRQMSDDIHTALADARADLAKAKAARGQSADNDLRLRKTALQQICAEVEACLDTAKADRASAEAERARHATGALKLRRAALKAITNQVSTSLGDARSALAGAKEERQRRAASDLGLRRTTARERMAKIGDLLESCRSARQEAVQAWQRLANLMPAGNMTPLAAETPEQAARKSPDGAKLKGGTVGKTFLHDSLYAYLVEHPEGARMVRLERDFDMPRIHIWRVLKDLVDNGKVEKQDKLYLAT